MSLLDSGRCETTFPQGGLHSHRSLGSERGQTSQVPLGVDPERGQCKAGAPGRHAAQNLIVTEPRVCGEKLRTTRDDAQLPAEPQASDQSVRNTWSGRGGGVDEDGSGWHSGAQAVL